MHHTDDRTTELTNEMMDWRLLTNEILKLEFRTSLFRHRSGPATSTPHQIHRNFKNLCQIFHHLYIYIPLAGRFCRSFSIFVRLVGCFGIHILSCTNPKSTFCHIIRNIQLQFIFFLLAFEKANLISDISSFLLLMGVSTD